jgi:hypothetical protein
MVTYCCTKITVVLQREIKILNKSQTLFSKFSVTWPLSSKTTIQTKLHLVSTKYFVETRCSLVWIVVWFNFLETRIWCSLVWFVVLLDKGQVAENLLQRVFVIYSVLLYKLRCKYSGAWKIAYKYGAINITYKLYTKYI